MRINEVIHRYNTLLAEGLMVNKEWVKPGDKRGTFKYSTPFIEKLLGKDPIEVTAMVQGEPVEGFISPGRNAHLVAKTLEAVIKKGAAAFKTYPMPPIEFQPAEEDADGNLQPSGDITTIRIQDILKDDKITGSVRVNLGNIAEIALGCAVTAKYKLLKEDGTASEVTPEMVIEVGQELADGAGRVSGRAGKDNLEFELSVPAGDKTAFFAYVGRDPKGRSIQDLGVKDETIKGMTEHIVSAAKYVNTSKRVAIALQKPAQDPRENTIGVKSDGGNAEQQKTTKVDLKIQIDPGTDPSNPNNLEVLNLLSIKAGRVKQFGQVSGYEFEKINGFFETSLDLTLSPATQKKFAAPDPTAKKKDDAKRMREENYATGFKYAYDEMYKQLNRLKSNQVDLIERVYKGLVFHATRNEPGVEMVILSPDKKTAFKELTFGKDLRNALDDYRFTITRGNSDKMHVLQIHGFPVTEKAKNAVGSDKELLVQYRSYAQDGAVRNIVEMGGLLKTLADWEEIEKRNEAKANKEKEEQSKQHGEIKSRKHPDVGPVTPAKKQVAVDAAPAINTPGVAPQTTTYQNGEFTAPTTTQAGMPQEEEPAMMEMQVILKNAGLLG